MNKIKDQCKKYYSEELKQREAITKTLVGKILFSKRLLEDHVQSLGKCLTDLKASESSIVLVDPANLQVVQAEKPLLAKDIFTVRNACLLIGSTFAEHYFLPKTCRWLLVPSVILSGSFGTVCMVKSVFIFRNKMVESQLNQLIKTIDEFANCIRKNMAFFNEKQIMKSNDSIGTRHLERAWDCITIIKTATEVLYEGTRKLETEYPLNSKLKKYYSSLEDLKECVFFRNNVTDYTAGSIKDFHNIFAYVQSNFLYLLSLTILTYPSLSRLNTDLVKIDSLLRQMVQEEHDHFINLVMEEQKVKQMEIDALNATRALQNRQGPVAILQDSSLKLSARMVAIAAECQNLDKTLQKFNDFDISSRNNSKILLEIANNFKSIESSLSVCTDDFQRLMLVYHKILNSKNPENDNDSEKAALENEDSSGEGSESFLRVEISNNSSEEMNKDDFYAYMFDAKNPQKDIEEEEEKEKSNKTNLDLEILNFEKRITKGKFRPVLNQLKDKIDPIRKNMLEKERAVLTAKGIDVDELLKDMEPAECLQASGDNKEINAASFVKDKKSKNVSFEDDASDDSEGSADLDFKQRTKKLKDRDNFAEMRRFLAQKDAINILNLDNSNPPRITTGDEEVLESEC